MAFSIRSNALGMAKWKANQSLALRLAGDIVAARITPEVPIDTGQLRRSAYSGGQRVGQPGDTDSYIQIAWTTDYAAKCWYGDSIDFREPGTHAYWGLALINNKVEMDRIMAGCLALFKL